MNATAETPTVAETVRVSYRAAEADPADGDGLGEDHVVHDNIQERPFVRYLARAHGGAMSVGDEWSEFVNCGCGATTDVVLRVESVEGASVLGEETDIVLVPRRPA